MIFGFDEFELDGERRELRRQGQVVKTDSIVLKLLTALLDARGHLITKDELIDAVWGGRAVADNVITVSMARLRKTLGQRRGQHEYVATVYGRGYRFARDVRELERSAFEATVGASTQASAPPFVGRERVMARLRAALGEARKGRGRACALLGEPGIGKTRVIEMLEREVEGGELGIAWGYCREAGDTPPLAPFIRILRSVSADVSDVPACIDGPERYRGIDALVQRLVRAAEHKPWLFVLDDLHRADAATLELLQLLLDEIAHAPILIVTALRHERSRHAAHATTLLPYVLGHRNCERIELERLREADVAAYVGAMFQDADRSLCQAIFAKSEGNPFYMNELARQLGGAEPDAARALAVPDSALELLRQHVLQLEPDTRATLSAAAVIGRSFELPLLASVTGRDPSELMLQIDEALASETVVAAPDSMTAFAFAHELLRAVLYDSITPAEQRRLHARIAESLEQRHAAGETVQASELAYHFHAALPDGDLRKTVQYCRGAAQAAGRVFAHPDVTRYIQHALEALDLMPKPSVRLRMQLLRTLSLYARGHARAEAESALREAIALASAHGDGEALVLAAFMLNQHPGLEPLPGAAEAMEQALALLPDDAYDVRSVALASLACAAPNCYSAARSDELLAQALELADKGRTPTRVHGALRAKLYLHGGPAYDGSLELCPELERISRENPVVLPVLPAEIALHRAFVALSRGDRTRTEAGLERAIARCRELRMTELLWHCERFAALVRLGAGACTDSARELDALQKRAEARTLLNTETFCAFDRALIATELEDVRAPLGTLRAALAYKSADPPSVWSLKLRALASAGLHDDAQSTLRAVSASDLAQLPCDLDYLGTLAHVARAALLLDARDHAQAAYQLLRRYPDHFAGQVASACDGAVPQLLGMLSHGLGQRERAIAELERGLEMNARAGFVVRTIETKLQLARCLRETREGRARPLALSAEAGEAAAKLGLKRMAREASTLHDALASRARVEG